MSDYSKAVLIEGDCPVEYVDLEVFVAPPLPAPGKVESARALATGLGLSIGPPVDFWTEAALFSEAGLDTIVYGPGDIAQAHTADEHVSLMSLAVALLDYQRILSPS